jgi:hypothetical protein
MKPKVAIELQRIVEEELSRSNKKIQPTSFVGG